MNTSLDYCVSCGQEHSYMSGNCDKCGGNTFRAANIVPFNDVCKEVALTSFRNTERVYWSPKNPEGGGFNSYVLQRSPRGGWMHRGEQVKLFSVNGMGEVRWEVHPRNYTYGGSGNSFGGEGAVEYFGLTAIDE